jgi:hypothetical protein
VCIILHNARNIRGLCSPMPKSEPSVEDYIRWLFTEVTGLSEVFADVNENFISVAVEGTLVMARDSIDLSALQTMATDSRVDILPSGRDV